METVCLACGYQRRPADQGPDWQCPSCGKAYAKTSHESPGSSSGYALSFVSESHIRLDEGPVAQESRLGAFSWFVSFGAIPVSLLSLLVVASSRHQLLLAAFVLAMPLVTLAIVYVFRDSLLREMGEYSCFVLCASLLGLMIGVGGVAIADSQVFDDGATWRRGMMFAIPFLLLCAAVVRRLNAEVSQRTLWYVGSLLIIAASIYGGALAALGNRWLDDSRLTVYQATVIGKHVSSGKGGGVYYTVKLAPWGPVRNSHDIAVRLVDYNAAQIGLSFLCIATHPGAFGLAWGQQVACDGDASAER